MTRPGDADRPYVGTSYEDRPQITMTYRGGGSGQQYDYQADNIEDAYADHLVDHGKSTYPGMDPQAPATPTAPADPQGKELLAAHPINPGSAKKELFVDLDTYEDPATGNPRPTSPVEKLRQDLDRLQGAAGDKSLTVLLTMSALSQRDLGAWQAAEDLRLSTDKARSTLEGAIQRVWTVYSSVIQALDDTIKTAKAADRSVAADVRTRT